MSMDHYSNAVSKQDIKNQCQNKKHADIDIHLIVSTII